tara:strand:+ start:106 stop:582 length:477 start_codon:yes stop_codon:yes gene_type:complete
MVACSALTVLDSMVLLTQKKSKSNQSQLKFWKSKQLIVVWSYIKQQIVMKKFILLVFLMVFTSNAIAQDDLELKATEITNEMAEVLSLSVVDKTKVYEIQLKRFQEVASIREQYKDDDQTRKEELKKVYNRLFGKLKKALDKDKMEQWGDYKREIGRD